MELTFIQRHILVEDDLPLQSRGWQGHKESRFHIRYTIFIKADFFENFPATPNTNQIKQPK